MQLSAYGETDVGRKRKHNEDAFLVDSELGLFIVADGMGGHAAGEVASAKAVEVIQAHVASRRDVLEAYAADPADFDLRDQCQAIVEEAIHLACAEIFDLAQSQAEKRGMGTTTVLILKAGSKAIIGHVGDSRAYLLRNEKAYQLTEDHTLVNAQLKQGLISKEEAKRAAFQNVITRSVGYQRSVQVDTLLTDLLPGDRYLLCSDGLSGYVREDEYAKFLGAGTAGELPEKLLKLANHRGGKDNITAIILEVEGEATAPEKADVEERMEVLRRIPLFKHLKYKELIQLLSIVQTRTAVDGETLITEGEAGEELFVILRGGAEVRAGETPVAQLGAGSHFGEMALIDASPRSATVVAVQQSTLLIIDRDNFFTLLRRDSLLAVKLLWAFLQILSERLRATNEELSGAKSELAARAPTPFGQE
ncbi:MAG: Stp1/IreP family PP2C-type Ser/Thr phosphatase [Deltaproteobacteria bacterium]|nr:Stp1/IreP family PP2C-type Ser/Thr phosphatase [Deltaproteobacteria bacterium]